MDPELPHITAAELRILKILWKSGAGTVRDVKRVLTADGSDEPAYTTVMTLMKQMAEKGALSVDRSGRKFVYTPRVLRDQVLRHRLSQFIQTVFDGSIDDLVLQLVEDAELTLDDLRRLESRITRREQRRGDES